MALHMEQDRLPPICAGWSRLLVDKCPKHPNSTSFCRRYQIPESLPATVVKGIESDEPEPADARLSLRPDSQFEADRHPPNGKCSISPPQVTESRACPFTLLDDESTGEPEPADAEPSLLPQSASGTASYRRVDLQQRSNSGGLSPHSDRYNDDDQASDLEERHPLISDDRGEKGSEEGPTTLPQAQESAAGPPTLPDDEGNNGYMLADASPPMQPPVDPQQRSGSYGLSQRPNHRSKEDQASGPEERHHLALEDEQDEEISVVPTQGQESRKGMASLSGDKNGNTEPSMQPYTSQEQVDL